MVGAWLVLMMVYLLIVLILTRLSLYYRIGLPPFPDSLPYDHRRLLRLTIMGRTLTKQNKSITTNMTIWRTMNRLPPQSQPTRRLQQRDRRIDNQLYMHYLNQHLLMLIIKMNVDLYTYAVDMPVMCHLNIYMYECNIP
jgi:hypothetical protein